MRSLAAKRRFEQRDARGDGARPPLRLLLLPVGEAFLRLARRASRIVGLR
jgi:hypothetical protein